MRNLFILCLVIYGFSGCLLVQAQETAPADTSQILANQEKTIPSSYLRYPFNEAAAAIATVNEKDFNQGLISDPMLLLQGKVAGLQVYNRGGDPNLSSIMRIRGFSSYSQAKPLVVIDGLVGASLASLDPNDIADISILKDGSAQALYGIRASNGVILIKTKSGAVAARPFSIHYTGQVALADAYSSLRVMSAERYRTRDGIVDLGSSTVWRDEILRSGLSQNHGLAIQGKLTRADTDYRISGNFRQVEGVLQKSGFDQVNLRAQVNSNFGLDKLSWQLSTAYTNRDRQFGFSEVFAYATIFNPTAPIYASDAPFAFNTEQYGGFFEMLGLFDAFNPKAIVELNDQFGEQRSFNAVSLLSYEMTKGLCLNLRYAYQDQFDNRRAYYSPQSLFRGGADSWRNIPKGRGDLWDLEQSLSLYELYANYQQSFGESTLYATLGTSYTDGRYEDRLLSLAGINDREQIRTQGIGDFADWQAEDRLTRDSSYNAWNDRNSAIFGQAHLSVKDQFFFDLSLRYEGSSKLGLDQRWGWFPAVGAAVDLAQYFPKVEQLKLRVGYGITGAVPDQGGRAAELIQTIIIPDSITYDEIIQEGNPDLRWEQKQEFNFGIDLQAGWLTGYANWYHRRVSDWVDIDRFEGFYNRYTNQHALTSTGIELGLDVQVVNTNRLVYNTGLRFAHYQSKYAKIAGDQLPISSSCCARAEPLIVGKKGEAFGNLLGPVFSGEIDEFGDQVYEDVNGDGQINAEPWNLFEPENDLTVIGNGLPDVELGWTHQLRLGPWELQAFLRAALGHSLVNRARQQWEPDYFTRNPYNYVDTDLAIAGLQTSRYSSLYVERADFLKLDYLSFAYHFPKKEDNGQLISLSLTVQNVLIASRYSGSAPEPALLDTRYNVYNSAADPLAPGIDRLNTYLPATSFVFGLKANF